MKNRERTIKKRIHKEGGESSKTKDVQKTVKDYIYYFNNERLAYSLNYKSPIQYRTELSFK